MGSNGHESVPRRGLCPRTPGPLSEMDGERRRGDLLARSSTALRRNPRSVKGSLRSALRANPCRFGEPAVATRVPDRGDRLERLTPPGRRPECSDDRAKPTQDIAEAYSPNAEASGNALTYSAHPFQSGEPSAAAGNRIVDTFIRLKDHFRP